MTRCFHIALFCVVAIVWCQCGMLLNYSITRNSAGGCCLFHTQRQVIIRTNREVSTFLSFTFAFVSFHVLGQLKHNENHLRHLCTYLESWYTFLSTIKCLSCIWRTTKKQIPYTVEVWLKMVVKAAKNSPLLTQLK